MNRISLALMGKLAKLHQDSLAEKDTFVAINKLAEAYTLYDFEQPQHPQEFAEITNFIVPSKRFYEPDTTKFIWDVYKDSLGKAFAASGNFLTAEEEAKLQEALAYVEDPENRENYYTCQDEALAAAAELASLISQKTAAERDDDTDAVASLNDLIAIARQREEAASRKWQDIGNKLVYENHQNIKFQLEARYPSNILEHYKSKLSGAEREKIGKGTSGYYYPTSFVPSNFFKEGGSGWASIAMDAREVDEYYNYAKNTVFKDYQDFFSDEQDELEIEKISVDIGILSVVRDWFSIDLFHQRFWDLPKFIAPLSDGEPSPTGSLSVLPVKMIFLRNLDVELKEDSAKNRNTFKKTIGKNLPIFVGNVMLNASPQLKSGSVNILSTPKALNYQAVKKDRQILHRQIDNQSGVQILKGKNINALKTQLTASSTVQPVAFTNFTGSTKIALGRARVLTQSAGMYLISHKAVPTNISSHITNINNGVTNGNRNFLLFTTQKYGVYNTHETGVWFNGSQWTVYNQNRKPMPKNNQVNVLAVNPALNRNVFVHTTTKNNTSGHITTLNHGLTNNQSNAIVLVTQHYGKYNVSQVGVWFSGGKWKIYNEDLKPMPIGTKFNILVLKPGAPIRFGGLEGVAFQHKVTDATKQGSMKHVSYINNGFSNGVPQGIVFVTQRWINTYNPNPIGVWYSNNKWTVYNQNRKPLPNNVTFNVLVVKPARAAVPKPRPRPVPRPAPKPRPAPSKPVEKDPDKEIEDLFPAFWLAGFVCKNLPKAPNPDPDLDWI
ncbi:hypothetical protein QGP82_34230 [Leptothoe sp. LEGE 181152]|nr:hypothetical protein [Leptothoe sp. LEGE 181152]